jgi:hypothetical protein
VVIRTEKTWTRNAPETPGREGREMPASQLALPPAARSDAFPDDPEHAAVVLAPEIRVERLGMAHEEIAFVCMPLRNRSQATRHSWL